MTESDDRAPEDLDELESQQHAPDAIGHDEADVDAAGPELVEPEVVEPEVEAEVVEPEVVEPEVAEPEVVEPENTGSPGPEAGGAVIAGRDDGWVVLGRALRPRATRAQLLAGLLCAALGFAVVVQVRQTDESTLSSLRQEDLVRILDETTERGDALREEITDLRGELDELVSGSDRQQAALDALRRSAVTQGILSGRLPAEGPGVRVDVVDPDGGLEPITMLNLLEELRNAGAEAIQLGDQRVTASSAFTGSRGHLQLDGQELSSPYTWYAIGDSQTLSIALQIPGGALATVRGDGATGAVTALDKVEITAVRDLPDPQYASAVTPSGE
ncbi:DUF881 domain-containing protein [Cellulomonas composti]|uniref:Uncharacterized protein n=1 Tax=Cellulomonas composti TaxID=266130 RepID=A0A511J771_9CELL|nr:DUF881 domain-containing protein [Cellulomonas composti]GEL93553.1 hypothetical protein CCO02nite_02110 [Cellulomonas composti]